MSRKKQLEQLSLPEIDPAPAVEIATTAPIIPIGIGKPPKDESLVTTKPRPAKSAVTGSKAAPRPRRSSGKAESPRPALRPSLPQLVHHRQDDSLHIRFLSEAVAEDLHGSQLTAGYTSDGRLVEIRIPASVLRPTPAQPGVVDPKLPELLSALREELIFLKSGLAIVLAAVVWLLLR